LALDEVAQLLQISESGVYRLIRRGELAFLKVGGRTRFEPAAIRGFIAAQRTIGQGPSPGSASNESPHEEAA
jgi:excisionase family DNA binding protein